VARDSEFVRHVLELMAPLGAISARAMFGGFGIYLRDTVFAIVDDDRLYFRTDAITARRYLQLGLGPFTYVARGRTIALQYHEAPPEALESWEIMYRHALEALAVARTIAGRGKKTLPRPARRHAR
jgi:DNA transformation protein